ncbi:hypothetical protein CDD82_2421 [Ophiocordyceps australis]|uniref:J domain-containing protein n=1 Tax=Ophiocordyceps australis TaxID=1399860 RepID=A0A2C5ZI05_9HYPO|nr:hypothetical protein CDD82_2421 [Ophiocordyceps australis]
MMGRVSACCCCGEWPATRHVSLASLLRRNIEQDAASTYPSKYAWRYTWRSASTHSRGSADNGPPAWPRDPHPTPYQILGMHKGAPYTKSRFYQLVKLYHPDTQNHGSSSSSPSNQPSISRATRLERYHLVVAANDILSDPEKRRLYDNHDIGWSDHSAASAGRPGDPQYKPRPTVYNNATWEDWERWHQAQKGHQAQSPPLYMSNGTFAAVVVMMCMIGALAQANRAERSGISMIHATNASNDAIGKEMLRKTISSVGLTKDQRVDSFLRDRENVAYSYKPENCHDGPQSGKNA